MLSPDYPLATERLLLRPFRPDDLEDVYAYQSRADVCRYIPYPPRSRERVAEILDPKESRPTLAEPGLAMIIAVEEQSSGHVIGDVMLAWKSREHGCGELGYVFNPDFSGYGYATEAAREILRLGFGDLGLHRMIARLDARNGPSIRLLERLGMRQEAHLVQNEFLKGEWTDELDFAILRAEWEAADAAR